jgi:hypothetical protein
MPSSSPAVRLGTGAGFSADRLDPAVALVAKGRLNAIIFECIGKRTLAFGHRDRMANPEAGYYPLLERRLRAVLPLCVEYGTRLITNMGVAQSPRRRDQASPCSSTTCPTEFPSRDAREYRTNPRNRPKSITWLFEGDASMARVPP